jgi:AcrR family transcriptional regulator
VAEGTIYRHFPSKEDLLTEICRAAVRAFVEPLKSMDPASPCRERLDAVATRWAALAAREPALVRIVFEPAFARLLDERSRAAQRDLRAQLEQVVAAGKASGHVRLGGADLWTDVWLRLVLLALERVAAGQWQPADVAAGQVRQAAWDAIRLETANAAPATATHDSGPGDLP